MKATPTQLKRLADLLTQPADDVDTLALSVWNLVDDLMSNRDRFVTVAWHPAFSVLTAYGPYNTDLQARRDAPKRIVNSGGTQVRIAKLYDPDRIDPETMIFT